jgi:hypothetical protein
MWWVCRQSIHWAVSRTMTGNIIVELLADICKVNYTRA